MSIFEKATRGQLRFPTNKGLISVEDVWQLPLTRAGQHGVSLETLAQHIYKELNTSLVPSFVSKRTTKDTTQELRFDIVKHIIAIKLAEQEASVVSKEKSERKQKILGVINKKKDEELSNLSVAELEKLL